MSFFDHLPDCKKVNHLFEWVITLGLIILTTTLLFYAYMGIYKRFLADDYCFLDWIKNKGIIGGAVYYYDNISNRFGAFIFFGLVQIFGEFAFRFLPGEMILLLVLSLAWNLFWFSRKAKIPLSWKMSFLCAMLTCFFILFEAPNINQSFYWYSGMANYFTPMVIFLMITGILLWQMQVKVHNPYSYILVLLIALLTFINGGMSETAAAFQATSLALLLGWAIWKRKNIPNHFFILLLTAFFISLIVMGMLVIAPGNQWRLKVTHQTTDIWVIVRLSFQYALDFIIYSIRGLPIPILASFLTSAILFCHISTYQKFLVDKKQSWLLIIIIPITIYLLITAACAPTVFGMTAYPEPRTLFVARFIMTVGTIFLGGFIGIIGNRMMNRSAIVRFFSIIFLILSWIYPLRVAIQIWQQIPTERARAVEWDNRREEIAQKINLGAVDLEIPKLESNVQGLSELDEDPQFWVNKCAANYYGVNTIRAVTKKP